MALPRAVRLETLILGAAVAALIACGSAGDGTTTSATCAGCEGALCGGTCTDLSPALGQKVQAALPASACAAQTTISGVATVCSAHACPAGGAQGCAVALAWGPVALGRATHQLEGTVTATSSVDAHAPGTDCTATVTAVLSYTAAASFSCAPGSETATFGAITSNVESSSVSPGTCGLLATFLDQFRSTFEAQAERALQEALAGATTSLTTTCP